MTYLYFGGIYFLGCILYCVINAKRVGDTEFSIDYEYCCETTVDSLQIAFESIFWWAYLTVFIIISPVLLLKCIVEECNGKEEN